ncbi:peptidylprolyl isomerase [Hyphomicrobium sp. CS1BSMeth3]|uniref:peptidylprolyl isomerase n=1 Tax=Hyphomicrobium sp. CS1BSMeth3 TaxID=1892844 RepID=UPI0009FB8214|nr:peptidylprolyl isomerase [Hyphomicrobium sp. CS1BSMeth3]
MIRTAKRFATSNVIAHHLVYGAVSALLLSAAPAVLAQTKKSAATPASSAQATDTQAAARKTSTARSVDTNVVARAGDNDLTRDDVRSFVADLSEPERAALARNPALLSQSLRVLLANQLVLKEALAKNWQDQPNVVAQLKRLHDNAIVESYLQSVSAPPQGFPSESELQATYDANKAALAVPRTFQVAQVFIALPAGADKDAEDKARKKLADVQAKLKSSNADFAAIAKADSDERASGERGGEIGWLAEDQLKPEIKAQVLALSKGMISAPIQAPGGWHIVKLLDAKEAGTRQFAEVKEALAQRLRAQRVEANRRAYLAKLLEQSPPTINELALSGVLDQPKQ